MEIHSVDVEVFIWLKEHFNFVDIREKVKGSNKDEFHGHPIV